jgi:hypothetical protein
MNLMFMEKRFLRRFRVIADSLGNHLLTQDSDKKYVSFLYGGITLQAKTPGSYFWMERDFEIESLGLLLLNKEKYFFRLRMTAGGQPELLVDIKPDWDLALIKHRTLEDTLKDTVREFRFRD